MSVRILMSVALAMLTLTTMSGIHWAFGRGNDRLSVMITVIVLLVTFAVTRKKRGGSPNRKRRPPHDVIAMSSHHGDSP